MKAEIFYDWETNYYCNVVYEVRANSPRTAKEEEINESKSVSVRESSYPKKSDHLLYKHKRISRSQIQARDDYFHTMHSQNPYTQPLIVSIDSITKKDGIKITMNIPNRLTETHWLSKAEIEGSIDKSLYIGAKAGEDKRYKYLQTPAIDFMVNSPHCKLDLKHFFLSFDKDVKGFREFLKLYYTDDPKAASSQAPLPIYQKIFSYLRTPKQLWVSDLGSLTGTYVRMASQKPYQISSGMEIIFGSYTHFYVKYIATGSNPSLHNTNFNLWMKFLLKIEIEQNILIVGLSIESRSLLNEMPKEFRIYTHGDLEYAAMDYKNPPDFGMPFVYADITTENSKSILNKEEVIRKELLVVGEEKKEFTVGRGKENDIEINEASVSKKQAKLLFDRGKWLVSEATEKPTANGTFIGITDWRVKDLRQPSGPYMLQKGEDIRIGHTFVSVMFNESG
jgi:pSer/pThr/pTyr-binding forkhead associated (FHA) protein